MRFELGVAARQGWEIATVLITVKAYPVIGRRTGESVCVAGVRVDAGPPTWIRLFPVPFRSLDKARQFEKYSLVQLRVHSGSGSDRRPESRQPDLDSMRVGERLGTRRGWADRWQALGGLVGATSACALYAGAKRSAQSAASLGLIKPAEILDIIVEPNPAYRSGGTPTVEVDLFGTETEALEAQPFTVKLRYRCQETGCRQHEQTLVDWEAGQLGRRMLAEGNDAVAARELVVRKYAEICSSAYDTHFYLGNQHQHPTSFLVLGAFWPPARSRPAITLF